MDSHCQYWDIAYQKNRTCKNKIYNKEKRVEEFLDLRATTNTIKMLHSIQLNAYFLNNINGWWTAEHENRSESRDLSSCSIKAKLHIDLSVFITWNTDTPTSPFSVIKSYKPVSPVNACLVAITESIATSCFPEMVLSRYSAPSSAASHCLQWTQSRKRL